MCEREREREREMSSAEAEQRTVELTFLNVTVFSDGSTHRAPFDPPPLPACPSPSSPDHVATADLTLNQAHGTWVRLFKPPTTQKLPILLYFHGGGFIFGSSSLPSDHSFLCKLAAHAPCLIVSVEYRLAPEHPLPAAYEDGIEALLWLGRQASVVDCSPHPWLSMYADFSKCFLGGDSAGANIAHHVAMGFATGLGFERSLPDSGFGYPSWSATPMGSGQAMEGVCVQGVILIHAFFSCGHGTISEFEAKIWRYSGVSIEHPFANPMCSSAPSLVALPRRILVAVASKDMLAARGLVLHQGLVEAGKEAKLFISQDEGHVFHLLSPDSKNVSPFLDELRDFISLH